MNYSASTKDVSNKYAFSKEVMRFYLSVYDLENTQIFFCHSMAVLILKPTGLILWVMPMYTHIHVYLHICLHVPYYMHTDKHSYIEILYTPGGILMSPLYSQRPCKWFVRSHVEAENSACHGPWANSRLVFEYNLNMKNNPCIYQWLRTDNRSNSSDTWNSNLCP